MRSYQVNWTLLFLSFVYCFTNVKLKSRDLKYDFFFALLFFPIRPASSTPLTDSRRLVIVSWFLKRCCTLLYWNVIVVEQLKAGVCFVPFFLLKPQNGGAQSDLGILEAGLIVTVLSFLFFFLYFCSVLSCPAHPPMLQTLNIAQVCSQPYCCIVTNDTLAALQPLIPGREYMYSQGLKLAGPLVKGKFSLQFSRDMQHKADSQWSFDTKIFVGMDCYHFPYQS